MTWLRSSDGFRQDPIVERGIDTRGVLLMGSALSDETVRHGGAYLVELVASAQRRGRFHVDQEG